MVDDISSSDALSYIHYAKASFPIEVTDDGIMISVSEEHLNKKLRKFMSIEDQ